MDNLPNEERWRKLSQLYHAALSRTGVERDEFLDIACEGDDTLRRELTSLLAYDNGTHDFLDRAGFPVPHDLDDGLNTLVGQHIGP